MRVQKVNRTGAGELLQYLHSLDEGNVRLLQTVEDLSISIDLSQAISGSIVNAEVMQTLLGQSVRATSSLQGDITFFDDATTVVVTG